MKIKRIINKVIATSLSLVIGISSTYAVGKAVPSKNLKQEVSKSQRIKKETKKRWINNSILFFLVSAIAGTVGTAIWADIAEGKRIKKGLEKSPEAAEEEATKEVPTKEAIEEGPEEETRQVVEKVAKQKVVENEAARQKATEGESNRKTDKGGINILHAPEYIYCKIPGDEMVRKIFISPNDTIQTFINRLKNIEGSNPLLTTVILIEYNQNIVNAENERDKKLVDVFNFSNDVSKENPIIIKYPNINLNVNCQLGKEPFKKKVSVSYENNIRDLLNMLRLDPKDFRFKNIKVGFDTCSINDTRSIYDIMKRVRVEKALKDDNYRIDITCEEAKIDVYIPSSDGKVQCVKCQVSEDSKIEDVLNQISQESFYNKSNLIIKFNGNQIEANSNTCKELIYSTNLGLENYKNGDQIIIEDVPVEIYCKIPGKSGSGTVKKFSIQPLSKMTDFINMLKEDLDQVSVVKLKCGNLELNSSIKDTKRIVSVLKGKFGENNVWEIVQEPGEQEVIFRNTDGQEFKMLLPKSYIIESLRDKLAEENLGDVSSEHVSLVFGGKVLDDQKTIGELKIPPDGVISIFIESEEDPIFLSTIDINKFETV